MGKDRSGAGAEGGVRAVEPPLGSSATVAAGQADRPTGSHGSADPTAHMVASSRRPIGFTGRARGHKLRPGRKAAGLTLPRLADADDRSPFSRPRLWLEVGFGGGEHALAQIARASRGVGLIACEVFENGICSLLSRAGARGRRGGRAPCRATCALGPTTRGCCWRLAGRVPGPAVPAVPRSLAEGAPRQAALRASGDAAAAGARAEAGRGLAGGQRRSDLSGLGSRRDGSAGSVRRAAAGDARGPMDWPPTRYEAKALRGRPPAAVLVLRRRAVPAEPLRESQ